MKTRYKPTEEDKRRIWWLMEFGGNEKRIVILYKILGCLAIAYPTLFVTGTLYPDGTFIEYFKEATK